MRHSPPSNDKKRVARAKSGTQYGTSSAYAAQSTRFRHTVDLGMMGHKSRIFADRQKVEVILGKRFHGINRVENRMGMRARLSREKKLKKFANLRARCYLLVNETLLLVRQPRQRPKGRRVIHIKWGK